MAYNTLKNVAHDCFGIVLSDEQATRAAKTQKNLGYYSDERMSSTGGVMDTADRDLLADFIVQDILGPGNHWPLNGDGADAMEIFKRAIVKAAPAKGYVLLGGVWPQVTTATPAPEDVYQIDGTSVYSLQDSGRYRKGVPLQENRIYFSVTGSATIADREKTELAEEIMVFLNARLELKRVGLLDNEGKLDVDTLSRIVDNGIESII